jgi:hypothetical protein
VTKTGPLSPVASTGIDDAPMVDSSAAMLYAFVNSDGGGHPSAGLYQIPVSFASGNVGTETTLGQGNNTGFAYDGAFDNTYFTSASFASPTGHLYVCGRASGSQTPTIYQVTITANVMNTTAVAGPALATGTPDCSPVTEISNSTDHIFVSVSGAAPTTSPISCPAANTGCIMAFDVGTGLGTWGPSKTTSAAAAAASGTGGIVIDNSISGTPTGGVSAAGTMQVYYQIQGSQTCGGNGTIGSGTGACQIQASQTLLQ